jgi:uncharacterized membrane protein YsdA (DUF1294 family)
MRTVLVCISLAALGMSLCLLVLMGADKRLAKTGGRRVPEKRLFLFALLGGAAGGLLGMYAFRHKTRHWYVVLGFWALTILQLAGLGALAVRFL